MPRLVGRLTRLVGGCLLLAGRVVAQGTQPSGGVRGSVYDSLITSAPLVGAEIWVEGTNRTTSTDADGRFELPDLPPGRWRLSFSHPVLDSMGLSEPEALIDTRTRPAEVRFAIPSPSRAHRMLCPHDPSQATGAIIALVRDAADGTALADVSVTAKWTVYALGRGGVRSEPREASARSDASGRVLLCTIPTDVAVVLEGQSGTGPSGLALVDLAGRPFQRAYLLLARGTATGAVEGVVRDHNGALVPGATVVAVGTEGRALADEFGKFTIKDVVAGSRIVEARAVGYPAARAQTTIRPGVTQRVDIALPDSIHELEPVTVVGHYEPYLTRVGFNFRRHTALGHFLDTTDIKKTGALQFEEVFRMVPGVRLRPNGSSYLVELQRGEGQITNPALANYCPPSYFIDGVYFPLPPIQTPSVPVVPEEVLAVEIYSNVFSAPPQYQRLDSGCGVILVWTRRGTPRRKP
ncbi:MAG TPA: carboxypeptidase regulatory-like domain-containing protein [Gemmatimonadales bacterium]|nr:carboxypeptidase regulatory-like domain-containing protein [Gemmatimonadales bacterium]